MPRSWKRKPNHNKRSYVSIPCLHYKKLKFNTEKREKQRKNERKKERKNGPVA